jgi:hypothetical protein
MFFPRIPLAEPTSLFAFVQRWLAVSWSGAALYGCAAHSPGQENTEPMSYVDVLHRLTDLDRLTRLHTGYKAGLFSSWIGADGRRGEQMATRGNICASRRTERR